MDSTGAADSHLNSRCGLNSSSIAASSAAAAAAAAAAEHSQAIVSSHPGVTCLEAAADVKHDSSSAEVEQQAAPAMPTADAPHKRVQDAAASMPAAKGTQQAGWALSQANASLVQSQAGKRFGKVREADKHPRDEHDAGQHGQAAAAQTQHQAGGGVENLREAEKQLNKVSWWLELTKGRDAAGKGSTADQQVRPPAALLLAILTCFTAPVAGVVSHSLAERQGVGQVRWIMLVQAGGCGTPASHGQGNGSSTETFLQHEAASCRTASAGLQLAPAAKRQLFQEGGATPRAQHCEDGTTARPRAEPSCSGTGSISGELSALLACS